MTVLNMPQGGGRTRGSFLNSGGQPRLNEVVGDRTDRNFLNGALSGVQKTLGGQGQAGRGATGTVRSGGDPEMMKGLMQFLQGQGGGGGAGAGAGGGGGGLGTPQQPGGFASKGSAPAGLFMGTVPEGKGPAPVGGQNGAVDIENLGAVIERFMGNPSRFDISAVKQAREHFGQNLEDEGRLRDARLKTGAASRGNFFGSSGLNTSLGDSAVQLQRGKADLDTNLLMAMAQTQGQDRAASINAGLGFGQQAQQGALNQAQIAGILDQIGSAGGPSINNILAGLFNQGAPGSGSVTQTNLAQTLGRTLQR